MSWDDWNNFNNNDNNQQDNNDNGFDENDNDDLDSFLSDDTDEQQENNNDFDQQFNEQQENSSDNVDQLNDNQENDDHHEKSIENDDLQDDNSENSQDSDNEEEHFKEIEEVTEDFYSAPGNTKNELIFSEKDAYRIVNVTKVLEECDHDMNVMLQSTFGFNSKASIIKKSINIVQLSEEDFESKISSVTGLKSIYDAVNPKEGEDPLDIAIQAISRVSSMSEKDRGNMISLARKISKEVEGVKNISVKRSQPAADIVSELRKAMTGEHNISDKVLYFGTLIETLKEAME